MDNDIKQFVHSLNKDANKLNNNIITKTNSLQNVPINNVYSKTSTSIPAKSASTPIQEVSYHQPDLKAIEKLTKNLQSMEKKIDRFFNLIEKRVVNNAKEVNIRIKLNEANENTNSGQE